MGIKTLALVFFLAGVLCSSLVFWIIYTTPRSQCQTSFFFQNPDFIDGPNIKWCGSHWNFSYPFSYNVSMKNGLATLFYNESSKTGEWGGVVFLQGKLPHSWGSCSRPLGGLSKENNTELDYIEFRRCAPITPNKYFLHVRVKILARNFTYLLEHNESVSNVGVDLMFGFDSANYEDSDTNHRVAIHADIIFSRAYWFDDGQIHHNEPPEYANSPSRYDRDWHLTLIVGKISDLGTWYEFNVDLYTIFSQIFKLTGTNTLRYYGAQVYADGTNSFTEAVFDYVDIILI